MLRELLESHIGDFPEYVAVFSAGPSAQAPDLAAMYSDWQTFGRTLAALGTQLTTHARGGR